MTQTSKNDMADVGLFGASDIAQNMRGGNKEGYQEQSKSGLYGSPRRSYGTGIMSVSMIDAFEVITSPLMDSVSNLVTSQARDIRMSTSAIVASLEEVRDVTLLASGKREEILSKMKDDTSKINEKSEAFKAVSLLTTPLRWMGNILTGWRKDPFQSGFDKVDNSIQELTQFMMTGEIDRSKSLWQTFASGGLSGVAKRSIKNAFGIGGEKAQERENARAMGEEVGFSVTGILADYLQKGEIVTKGRQGGILGGGSNSIGIQHKEDPQDVLFDMRDLLESIEFQGGMLLDVSRGSFQYNTKSSDISEGLEEKSLKIEKKSNGTLMDIKRSLNMMAGVSIASKAVGMASGVVGTGAGLVSRTGISKVWDILKNPKFGKTVLKAGALGAVLSMVLEDNQAYADGSEEQNLIDSLSGKGAVAGGVLGGGLAVALGLPAIAATVVSLVAGWIGKSVADGFGKFLVEKLETSPAARAVVENVKIAEAWFVGKVDSLWQTHLDLMDATWETIKPYAMNPTLITNKIESIGTAISDGTYGLLTHIDEVIGDIQKFASSPIDYFLDKATEQAFGDNTSWGTKFYNSMFGEDSSIAKIARDGDLTRQALAGGEIMGPLRPTDRNFVGRATKDLGSSYWGVSTDMTKREVFTKYDKGFWGNLWDDIKGISGRGKTTYARPVEDGPDLPFFDTPVPNEQTPRDRQEITTEKSFSQRIKDLENKIGNGAGSLQDSALLERLKSIEVLLMNNFNKLSEKDRKELMNHGNGYAPEIEDSKLKSIKGE